MDIKSLYAFAIPFVLGGGLVLITLYLLKLIPPQAQNSISMTPPSANPSEALLIRKMNAVERLVLFLERARPMHAFQRITADIRSVNDAYLFYRRSLQEEFFHNIVQQTYISDEAWEKVLDAKETLEKMAEDTSKKIPPGEIAPKFFKTLDQLYESMDVRFIEETISALKKEIF